MGNLKMTLTDKHITYENDCRQMFVGQIIRAVIYGELKYFADEDGNNINPQQFYKTKYPDIDTLDHSIYFKTDKKTIYVFWDNTFICYGLQSKQLDLTETTNDYEQKWDVSNEKKWVHFIGQKIVDFKIVWEEIWSSNLDGSNNVYTTYPQTFEIVTENGKSIFVTASELKDSEDEYYSQMDNLLVTMNYELLQRLENLEQKQIGKYRSKKTLWTQLFGQ
ncbi:MAG: hypothetical protein H6567_05820 [Lewinellaceae bacterium]|nr:hypothetical protein [Lewinellaceae bacterium]